MTTPSGAQPKRAIHTTVWALGLTSMCTDISSEMIHALLPIYLTTVLGASVALVGLIEGIAEATALAVKVFSGALSDWLGKRKLLVVLGYGMAAFTKPIFPLASSVHDVLIARFVDRIGKGVRDAPRDALIADVTPPEHRGAAYGLRQTLDTIGAAIGPLVAIGLMLWTANNYQIIFWIAVIPGILAFLIVVFGIKEPVREGLKPAPRNPLSRAALRELPATYWIVLALGAMIAFSRVSEAFLILRASGAGLSPAYAPLVLVAMSVVYAVFAYPAGLLVDKYQPRNLLVIAIVSLAIAEGTLAYADTLPHVFVGILLWGAHMAFSQGLLATLVAEHAPETARGTAFGLFNLASALAMLLGNGLFGTIWSLYSPNLAYGLGAGAVLLALPLLAFIKTGKADADRLNPAS